jgi:hypothetical protein
VAGEAGGAQCGVEGLAGVQLDPHGAPLELLRNEEPRSLAVDTRTCRGSRQGGNEPKLDQAGTGIVICRRSTISYDLNHGLGQDPQE